MDTNSDVPNEMPEITAVVEQLAVDPETGFRVSLQRLPPGFVAPKHRHTDFEWVYILEGTLQDEFGSYGKGTFKVNPKGSVHKSYSEHGCTLIVFMRGTHEPVAEQQLGVAPFYKPRSYPLGLKL
ncbi:MAG: cupin domain-containing protein [Candidatus Liptonbacteria bacterium]